MSKDLMIEILMADRHPKSEAEKCIKNGSIIFEDLAERLDDYLNEWDIDEDEKEGYYNMVNNKVALPDWGIVEYEGKTYYISYVL